MKTITETSPDSVTPARVEMRLPGFRQEGTPGRLRPGMMPRPVRLPRVARLMALAIKYQGMVSRGELVDYADIARLGYITRARATQVMNLLHLAPDIQEHLLFLDGSAESDGITERDLRRIAGTVYWKQQRKLWRTRNTATESLACRDAQNDYLRRKDVEALS